MMPDENEQKPLTIADLHQLKMELVSEISAGVGAAVGEAEKRIIDQLKMELVSEISTAVGAAEKRIIDHVNERTYDVETKLLRAFANFSGSNDVRMRKIEADASNLNTSSTMRFDFIEARLTALESKFILNPPDPRQ
jgi:hypothetical protein